MNMAHNRSFFLDGKLGHPRSDGLPFVFPSTPRSKRTHSARDSCLARRFLRGCFNGPKKCAGGKVANVSLLMLGRYNILSRLRGAMAAR